MVYDRSQLEPALRSSSTLTILEPHAGRALDKVVLFHQRWRQFAKKNADQVTVYVTPIFQLITQYWRHNTIGMAIAIAVAMKRLAGQLDDVLRSAVAYCCALQLL
jgi:hypothetical protein